MTEVLPSENVATDKRRNGQLSGGAAMEIAVFDFFEDIPTRTKIYPVHPQAPENTYRINSTTARKTGRLFRCSGRLFSKIHRKSLDLSGLRPVNRMASLPP